MSTERVKLDFYAEGKLENRPQIKTYFSTNPSIGDQSNDLLQRNALSLNSKNLENCRNQYKSLCSLQEIKKETNNYLAPLTTYNTMQKYNIKPDMTNKETYNLARSRYFSTDKESTLQNGFCITKEEFVKTKQQLMETSTSPSISRALPSLSYESLKDNSLVFDKNMKNVLRYPKGYWGKEPEKMTKTKVSTDAPISFHFFTGQKAKEFNDNLIKNEDTITVFSRYQKWITVTPRSKNRKHPLEKAKVTKIEESSKIIPKWMQIKYSKLSLPDDPMTSAEYNSLSTGKKMMMLVDKKNNPGKSSKIPENRSVFSLGDFRHHLIFKEDADKYSSKVSQQPKKFFEWNDGTIFHPKYKKDK